LKITAKTGRFNETELKCVEELWDLFHDKGREASEYTFIVAKENDVILGYACFGPHALTQGTFDLYWIAVDPDNQGRGVGKSLLEYVEREVLQAKGYLLLIETSSTLPYRPTRRFYRHSGYKLTARIHDFYSPGDDMLMFSKHLQPPSEEKQSQTTVEELKAQHMPDSVRQ
jgi:GNAT superfamily N-acetyltransferase